MKKKYFLLLLLAISLSYVKAQQHSFPTSNTAWVEIESGGGIPQEFYYHTYRYFTDHDTLHEGINYQVLNVGAPNPNDLGSDYIKGFYRTDSLKVFFKPVLTDSMEFLLYDFGLSVGDTFSYYSDYTPGSVPPQFILISIDSILIEGEYHRKFIFEDNEWFYSNWVEGVGSSTGFFPFTQGIEMLVRLVCFYQEGSGFSLDYNDEVHSCWGAGMDEQDDFAGIRVFPNPARDFLQLEGELSGLEIRLLSVSGNVILHSKADESVSLSGISPGMYYLQLIRDGKNGPAKKISIL